IAAAGSFSSKFTISGTGTVNLNDNDMIVRYIAPSPLPAIKGYLTTGFHAGAWDGAGISSMTAHNDPTSLTALGYAEPNDVGITTFDGQPITIAVLVKYTYYGDANLDGAVTTSDFQRFLDGLVTHGTTWATGDFTYDNKIDLGNDFNLFLLAYLKQGNPL